MEKRALLAALPQQAIKNLLITRRMATPIGKANGGAGAVDVK